MATTQQPRKQGTRALVKAFDVVWLLFNPTRASLPDKDFLAADVPTQRGGWKCLFATVPDPIRWSSSVDLPVLGLGWLKQSFE